MEEAIRPQLLMYLEDLDAAVSPDRRQPAIRTFDGSDADRSAWEGIVAESFKTRVSFRESMETHPEFTPDRVYFALADGIPAATASAWFVPKFGRRTGYLHMVGTRPKFGGQGLGRAVCMAALRQMHSEGRTDSVLETDDFRIPAIALYLSIGYRPLLVAGSQIGRWRRILNEVDAASRWPDASSYLTHELWPADEATLRSLQRRISEVSDEPERRILDEEVRIVRRLVASRKTKEMADPELQAFFNTQRARELPVLSRSIIEQLDTIDRRREIAAAEPHVVLNARDFGASGDGEHNDGPALRAAIDALRSLPSGSSLRIPAGRYLVSDLDARKRRCHLLIDGLEEKTIVGEGPTKTVLVGAHVGSVLCIENCVATSVCELGVDCDPLPFTQGRVVAVDPDGGTLDWQPLPGWPGAPDWLPPTPFDTSHGIPFGTAVCRDPEASFPFSKIEQIADDCSRLTMRVPWFLDHLPFPSISEGDTMTLHSRNIPGAQAAVWITANRHCEFREVGVYASWHHGFLVSENLSVRFIDCVCEPFPGLNRLAVTNADGFHVRNNRVGPHIVDCRVRATNDDASNLYTKAASVLATTGERTLIIDVPSTPEYRATDWQTDPRCYEKGDSVAIIHATTGKIESHATVTAIDQVFWRGVPRLQLSLSGTLPPLITREALGKTSPVSQNMEFYRIPPEEVIEHMVINLSAKSDGFVLLGNTFGENLVNGVKLKASNGTVAGNVFDRPTAIGISLCMRLTWQEAFAPRNVTIEDNLFRGCSGIEATVDYPGGRFHHGPRYIDGIEVRGNRFEDATGFGLRLANVESMAIIENRFTSTHPLDFDVHTSCNKLVVEGNTMNDRSLEEDEIPGGTVDP